MTYYEILQVTENASNEVIKMAYKALAKKYHPDTFEGNKAVAEEMMKKINQAYTILSDPIKRKEYDASLQRNQFNNLFTDEEYHNNTNTSNTTNKSNIKIPNLKSSIITIVSLLLVLFIFGLHPYIESSEEYIYNNAIIFCLKDLVLGCLLMCSAPLLIGVTKKGLSTKNIRIICGTNSIVVFILSWILTIEIGWISALIFYFINELILRLIVTNPKNITQKNLTISIGIILTTILITFVCISQITISPQTNNNSTTSEEYFTAKLIALKMDGLDSAYSDYILEAYEIDRKGNYTYGVGKEAVIAYINDLDIDYGKRIIIFRLIYQTDNTYNNDIVEYLNSRDDITYDDEVYILTHLGMTVDSNGNVYWE